MNRVDHWEAALDREVARARRESFDWPSHNCALWAARVVEAITGEDVLATAYRNLPRTERAIYAVLTGEDGTLRDAVTAALGEEKPAMEARRGDVVMLSLDNRLIVGVCLGAKVAAVGPTGLRTRPITEAVAAWSVG